MRRALFLVFVLAAVTPVFTQETERERRVFVPVEDLDEVLTRHGPGVLLPKAKFNELTAKARKNAGTQPVAPKAPVVSQANYTGRIDGEQLVISAKIEFQQFVPEWQVVPLPFKGVDVESALLDGQPAKLGPGLVVFSNTVGKHTLALELSLKLVNVGSDRIAGFSIPPVGVASLTVPVPAAKYLQVDDVPLDRPAAHDQPAEYTVALGGKETVSLRITDRQAEQARASLVFAQTGLGVHVAPEELTWQAVTNLQVFGQPIDVLEFVIPKSLEIISVESSGLERWEIAAGPSDETTLLKLTWRQAFKEGRVVTFKGVSATVIGQPWQVPTLALQTATSQTSSVLVQHPASLRLQVVEVTGARRIGADELKGDMPDMAKVASAQQQLHFAAWKPDYTLRFVTQTKARELQASIVTKLDLESREVTLVTSAAVQSRFAPLFDLTFTIPAGWTATEVFVNQASVSWEYVLGDATVTRVRVPFATPIAADSSVVVQLNARRTPQPDWPIETADPVLLPLPEVRVENVGVTEGTYQIAGDEDLEILPEELTGLDPARIKEAELRAARPPRLAYEYQDSRFTGRLNVTRKPARLAVNTLALHRLEQRSVVSHLELTVAIQGGGVRELPVLLSESAGVALRFNLLSGTTRLVEQTAAAPLNGERLWTLRFDQRATGVLKFTLDLEQPRPAADQKIVLPALRVRDSDRHDGYVAVEGHPDQQLTLDAKDGGGQPLAPIDVPDLPAATGYVPQQRPVSAWKISAGDYKVTVSDKRFDQVTVPTAICTRCDITSVLGETGELQQSARFAFKAVGVQSLQLQLPEGAQLWAVKLDGQPVEVRSQTAGVYAVPLPAGEASTPLHTLDVAYRQELPRLGLAGRLRQSPPQIAVVSGQGTVEPIDILERIWTLHSPANTDLTANLGQFEPDQKFVRDSLLGEIQRSLNVGDQQTLVQKTLVVGVAVLILGLILLVVRNTQSQAAIAVPVVLVLVVCVLIALSLPAIQSAREAAGGGVFATKEAARAPQDMASLKPKSAEKDKFATFDDRGAAGGEAPPMLGPSATPFDRPAPGGPMEAGDPKQSESKDEARLEKMPQGKSEPDSQVNGATPPGNVQPQDERPRPDAEEPPGPPVLAQPAAQPPQQTPPPPAKPEALDELILKNPKENEQARQLQAAAGKPTDRSGGNLSLSIELQAPVGSRTTKFAYRGTPAESEPELIVAYQSRSALGVVTAFIVAAFVLIGWLLQTNWKSLRVALVSLGLTVPLALSPLVPIAWLPYLDGVFLGTLIGLVLWMVIPAMGGGLLRLVRLGFRRPSLSVLERNGLAGGMLLLLLAGQSFAQDPQPAPNPAPVPAKPLPTIIIPFDSATDPKQAERIFLPQEKFLELWNQANPDKRKQAPAPVDGSVAEALYSAKLIPAANGQPARMELTARYALHSFRDQQVTLPLPLASLPLTSATLDGQTAPIVVVNTDAGPAPAVVLEKLGPHVVDLKFTLPADHNGQTGKFMLPLRPVAAGVLRFALPGKDLSLKVAGPTAAFRQVTQEEETVAVIPIAQGGNVAVSWTPAQVQNKVDGIVHVEGVSAVQLDDAGLRMTVGYQYTVRQGTLSEATFSVPAGVQVRQISGADIGGWTPPGDAEPRTLTVSFRRAVSDGTTLSFDLFVPQSYSDEAVTVNTPAFAPLGVTREIGTVAVFAAKHLAVSPGALQNLTQMDVKQFAAIVEIPRPSAVPTLLYRYSTRPFQLPLLVSRQKPVSKGNAEHSLVVLPRKIRMLSRVDLTLAGAPRSEILFKLPDGYLVYDVNSADVGDYSVQSTDTGTILHAELTAPRTGRVELFLDGVVPRDQAVTSATLALPAPLEISELRSNAAVWLDPLYTGTITQTGGWKSIDPQLLPETLTRGKSTPSQFAFSSTQTAPEGMVLGLDQAVPDLSGDVLTAVVVNETQVEHLLAVQWKISRGAETRFVFTTPDWLLGRLDVHRGFGSGRIRQVLSEKIDGNRVRWTLVVDEPQRETYFVTARAVLPPPLVGPEGAALEAPGVILQRPTNAADGGKFAPLATQRQYVLLINHAPWQLDPAAGNPWEKVLPANLPLKIRQALLDQAAGIYQLKSVGAATRWTVRAVQQVQSLPASVNLVEIVMVLARDGSWRAQANLKVQNRARQFIALRLPDEARVQSLFVQKPPSDNDAGQPQPPQPQPQLEAARPIVADVNESPALLIPMPKTAAGDLSTAVELVYSGRLTRPLPRGVQLGYGSLDLPALSVVSVADSPDFGAPVSRTEWTVYLPDDVEAIRWDDANRTNMTISAAGYDRLLADLSEQLSLRKDLFSLSSGKQQARARFNLKQFSVGQVEEYKRNSDLSEAQRQELETRFNALNAPALGITPGTSAPPQRVSGDEAGAKALEEQLQGDNNRQQLKDVQLPTIEDSIIESGRTTVDPNSDVKKKDESKPAGKGAERSKNQRSQLRSQTEGQSLLLNPDAANQQPAQQTPQANAPAQPFVPGQNESQQQFGPPGQGRGGFVADDQMARHPELIQGGQAAVRGLIPSSGTDAWNATGGLSLKIDIPKTGRSLTFSKVGGEPKLALGLRPKQSLEIGFSLIWSVLWLALGVVIVVGSRFHGALAAYLPPAAACVGLAWFFMLPAPWLGFVLFLFASVVCLWRWRKSGVPA